MPDTAWNERNLLACAVLGATGFSSYLGLPIFLGVLGEARKLSEQAIGWVGSVELLGLLLGSLLTARLIGRVSARALAVGGVLVAVAGQCGTIGASGIGVILLMRLLVGAGGGACYALAMACLAGSPRPTRNFSLFGLGLVVLGSIELVALPWLAGMGGIYVVLLFLAAIHGSAATLVGWLPAAGRELQPTEAGRIQLTAHRLGWLCLVGTFVYSVGVTSFWAYVERLGTAGGLSSLFVGNALNIANLASFVTCLVAYRVERRIGAMLAQVLTLCLTAAIFATWPLNASKADFAVRCFFYFQLLVVSQIMQQSVLARTDPSGRQAALMPAAQGAGFALGPIFGGSLLAATGNYHAQLIAEALSLLVTAAIFFIVYRGLSRAESAFRSNRGAVTSEY